MQVKNCVLAVAQLDTRSMLSIPSFSNFSINKSFDIMVAKKELDVIATTNPETKTEEVDVYKRQIT